MAQHLTGQSDAWELLRLYRQRYDLGESAEFAFRLEQSLHRRRAKAAALRRRKEHLESELLEVESLLEAARNEIAGSLLAAELFVRETIDGIRRERGEGWSPTPILGFRMWSIEDDGLRGAKTRWPMYRLASTCLNGVPGEDVPHSIGKCGPPACGIYATKQVEALRSRFGLWNPEGCVVAVVALTGKVVEHELGYRGAHAEVVAIGASSEGRKLLTHDQSQVAAMFENPRATLTDTGDPGRLTSEQLCGFLEQEKREFERWTWEERSG
ncbi:MAG: hypothetical protein WBM90_11570 [Acidimicrobiia bacterium]